MGTPLTFSVVVPVFDEEDTIGDCLTRLAAQFDQITEIVVVDNNSTDGGRAVIDAWCSADPRVRVIDEVRQGLVYARNTGLDAATGDLIARIDADSTRGKGQLEASLAQVHAGAVDVLVGALVDCVSQWGSEALRKIFRDTAVRVYAIDDAAG